MFFRFKKFNKLFFWQPPFDMLSVLLASPGGRFLYLLLDYFIWPFLAYISFLLVTFDPGTFWLILLAMALSVSIEYVLKSILPWKRPISKTANILPFGLEQRWALRGSFPSGHTAKTFVSFLLIVQYGVFSPLVFLLINIPLIISRIFLGFHYPIDIIGGLASGWLTWLIVRQVTIPEQIVAPIRDILNLILNYVFRS